MYPKHITTHPGERRKFLRSVLIAIALELEPYNLTETQKPIIVQTTV